MTDDDVREVQAAGEPTEPPIFVPMPEGVPGAAPEGDHLASWTPAREPRPVLGSALIVAGAALWAFVVMGTFTTSWLPGGNAPLGEGVAILLVALVTVAAWLVAARRSRALPIAGARGPLGRFVVVGLAAFTLWVFVVLFAIVAGRASGTNVDVFIAAFLLAVSMAAVFSGDRLLGRTMPKPSRPTGLILLLWLGVGMITLGSCVELVAEH